VDGSPVIAAQGLGRKYKDLWAVEGLDLTIQAGELFGLVGPDGAGKTTTLRLLAGLLTVSEGDAVILDFSLKRQSESIKPYIGYMAQQFSLYSELTVLENLQFFAEIFDVPAKMREERMDRLLAFAGLEAFGDRRAAFLSGGMQKKLALACTLIHQPRILLLDEPTTGVDPISRREFWHILNELHLDHTTILVSTPYMDEADRCSRVGLMYAGHLMVCDTPQNVRATLEGDVVEVRSPDWRAAREIVAGLSGVLEVQTYGESLHLLVDSGRKRIPEIERALKKSGLAYNNIRQVPARMEQAFISLIRKLEAG
jgi:ABC-2 type transport system ATP-binding protein